METLEDQESSENPTGGDEADDEGTGENEHQRIEKVREHTNAARSRQRGNALQQDAKLKEMLENADDIQSLEHFTYWKDEFLSTFRHFLDPDGTATAREADDELFVQMQKLAKILVTVKELCKSGGISEEKVSVKGQTSINKMISTLAELEMAIQVYWPKTQEDEERVGYTKFELAAVLVRDGFRVFDIMVTTRDYLFSLRDGPLKGDKFLTNNSRSIMNFYLKELDS